MGDKGKKFKKKGRGLQQHVSTGGERRSASAEEYRSISSGQDPWQVKLTGLSWQKLAATVRL